MKDDVHSYLDKEGEGRLLSPGTPKEAEAWDRLLDAFRSELGTVPPPDWLETRVMAEIESLPEPGLFSRVLTWLMAPRSLTLSPLQGGALATASLGAAALLTALILGPGSPSPGSSGPGQGEEAVVYVQFALDAPGARSVAVAGDFDGWTGSHTLSDLDGDGTWTGRVPLQPGVHAYMFLVDGTEWMTDPQAQRFADDGFGNQNAILAVAEPSA